MEDEVVFLEDIVNVGIIQPTPVLPPITEIRQLTQTATPSPDTDSGNGLSSGENDDPEEEEDCQIIKTNDFPEISLKNFAREQERQKRRGHTGGAPCPPYVRTGGAPFPRYEQLGSGPKPVVVDDNWVRKEKKPKEVSRFHQPKREEGVRVPKKSLQEFHGHTQAERQSAGDVKPFLSWFKTNLRYYAVCEGETPGAERLIVEHTTDENVAEVAVPDRVYAQRLIHQYNGCLLPGTGCRLQCCMKGEVNVWSEKAQYRTMAPRKRSSEEVSVSHEELNRQLFEYKNQKKKKEEETTTFSNIN